MCVALPGQLLFRDLMLDAAQPRKFSAFGATFLGRRMARVSDLIFPCSRSCKSGLTIRLMIKHPSRASGRNIEKIVRRSLMLGEERHP